MERMQEMTTTAPEAQETALVTAMREEKMEML